MTQPLQQQQIAVVLGLRRAFEKFRHHGAFTRRVKPIIEAELPGYTVSVDPDHYGLRTVRVWGNGLPYDGGVYLCWNGSKPWAEGMAEALEIADCRDYAERAAAGPYGATIAHGYLTLSMLSIFLDPILDLEGLSMRLNYGIDRVRFPHHVPVGSRVRARVRLESVDETGSGVRVGLACLVEIDGVEKPALVAHPVALLVRTTPS